MKVVFEFDLIDNTRDVGRIRNTLLGCVNDRKRANENGQEIRLALQACTNPAVIQSYQFKAAIGQAPGNRLTFTGLPSATQTLTINSVVFTARASGATGNEFNIGATAEQTVDNLFNVLFASTAVGLPGRISLSREASNILFIHGLGFQPVTFATTLSNVTNDVIALGTITQFQGK